MNTTLSHIPRRLAIASAISILGTASAFAQIGSQVNLVVSEGICPPGLVLSLDGTTCMVVGGTMLPPAAFAGTTGAGGGGGVATAVPTAGTLATTTPTTALTITPAAASTTGLTAASTANAFNATTATTPVTTTPIATTTVTTTPVTTTPVTTTPVAATSTTGTSSFIPAAGMNFMTTVVTIITAFNPFAGTTTGTGVTNGTAASFGGTGPATTNTGIPGVTP